MKNLRKVMSLMLALMMVIGVMSLSMAAIVIEEGVGSGLVDAGVLTGFDDGDLGLSEEITRAQVAILLTKGLRMSEDAEALAERDSKFKDVTPGTWFTGYVNLASDQGWINGDDTGNFRPEDPVQFREVITMLLGALGYTNENLGGQWPTNFVEKAVELGLVEDEDYSSKEVATRGDVVILIDRAFNYETNTFKEELMNEETVVDETVVDETVVDETVVDEIVVDEIVVDETVVDETVVDETVVDEIVVDEIVVDEPIIPAPDLDVKEDRPIGIITAMASELALLESKAIITEVRTIGNVKYHVGTLEGKDIVLVQAGVGKSLSSAGTAILINEFNVSSIIFTGIAGAVKDEIKVLDMVISTDLLIHDYGQITDEGFVWNGKAGVDRETGLIPIDENLMNLAFDAAVKIAGKDNAHKGRIVTGDQFVGSKDYVETLNTKFNAYATEMEGASVGRVAFEFGIPVVVIRSMSDKADGVARESMDNFGQKVADMSANIVMELLKNIK